MSKSAVRLFAILPREGHSAVIFRRGPSKLVQLIRWDTATDTFEQGQWLKGQIWERRADLSPSGDKLIYFAANYKTPRSWTAISKPPYLTALAFWEHGGGYEGGGLFESENSVLLNHSGDQVEPDKGALPSGFRVQLLSKVPVYTGYDPIYVMRLKREGWTLVQRGERKPSSSEIYHLGAKAMGVAPADGTPYDYGKLLDKRGRVKQDKGEILYPYDPPMVYEKRFEWRKEVFKLQMRLLGVGEVEGSHYVLDFSIEGTRPGHVVSLGRLDWADVDKNGNVLFAKDGGVFRLSPDADSANIYDINRAKQLADFSDSKFKEMPPSEDALQW